MLCLHTILRFFFSSIIFITSSFLSINASSAPNKSLNVITFNILAPCWASPSYYPAITVPYLDRVFRRGNIINFLKSQPQSDVIALQEVTQIEFGYINNALKNNYIGFMSFHSPTYWSNWITIDPPWEPNGNAIFLKKSRFKNIAFQDIALSDDGNHAAYAEAIDGSTNKAIRAVSIHLDSDYPYNRERELGSLLNFMKSAANKVDIIAGDFNIDIENSTLKQNIITNNFTNILAALGITEMTSPYSSTYYRHSVFGAIDAVIVRNGLPQSGLIYDFNLFNLYPITSNQAPTINEDKRITENMKISGSDHFPVGASFLESF